MKYVELVEKTIVESGAIDELEQDYIDASKKLLKDVKGKPKGYKEFLDLAVKGDFDKANDLLSKKGYEGAKDARSDMIK